MIRSTLRAYRDAFAGLPRDAWVLAATLAVNRAGSMVLPFITLYLTHERGLSVARAGLVLTCYGLGSAGGAWLGGWSCDRFGPTRTLRASLIAGGFALLVLGRARGFGAIAVAVVLCSLPLEGFRPAVMTDMARRAPAGLQVRAFALLRLAANVGVGIAPAVGGFLALRGYGWLFLADAVTCWLAAAVLLLAREPPAESGGDEPSARPAAARSPWTDGPFLALMGVVVLIAMVFFQVFSTLPLYLREVGGFREDAIGLLLSINPLVIVLFEMVLIHRVEKRDRLVWVGLGGLLLCGGFALMPLGTSAAFLALTVVVWTVGEMLSLPLTNAVVAARAGPRLRGRYMGAYMVTFSVAFILAPAVGTWVYERLGPVALWSGIGALGPPLWLACLALRPVLRPAPAAAPAPESAADRP